MHPLIYHSVKCLKIHLDNYLSPVPKIKLLSHINQKFKEREKAEMDVIFVPLFHETFNLNTIFGDF